MSNLPMPKILGSKRQISLLRRQFCKDLDDDQFETYVHVARATGLDPLRKQIYAILRWSSQENKNIMAIQTGIDGFRLIASRTGAYAGSGAPEFIENPDDPKHPLMATVEVTKLVQGEKCTFIGQARWEEFAQKKDGRLLGRWEESGHNQLAKCAEAQALRKGFPDETSGVVTYEEMGAADLDVKDTKEQAPKAILEVGKVYNATLHTVSIGEHKKKPTRLTFLMEGGAEASITTWNIHHAPDKGEWAVHVHKACQFSFTESPNKRGGEPYRDLAHFAVAPEKNAPGGSTPPEPSDVTGNVAEGSNMGGETGESRSPVAETVVPDTAAVAPPPSESGSEPAELTKRKAALRSAVDDKETNRIYKECPDELKQDLYPYYHKKLVELKGHKK